jgi:antitoxin VapB
LAKSTVGIDFRKMALPNGREAHMAIVRTRVVNLGSSHALLLPREVAFGEDVELEIVRSGNVMTIYPAALALPAMIDRLRSLPGVPTIEKRDGEELPERPSS